jgi:hypothetical protein
MPSGTSTQGLGIGLEGNSITSRSAGGTRQRSHSVGQIQGSVDGLSVTGRSSNDIGTSTPAPSSSVGIGGLLESRSILNRTGAPLPETGLRKNQTSGRLLKPPRPARRVNNREDGVGNQGLDQAQAISLMGVSGSGMDVRGDSHGPSGHGGSVMRSEGSLMQELSMTVSGNNAAPVSPIRQLGVRSSNGRSAGSLATSMAQRGVGARLRDAVVADSSINMNDTTHGGHESENFQADIGSLNMLMTVNGRVSEANNNMMSGSVVDSGATQSRGALSSSAASNALSRSQRLRKKPTFQSGRLAALRSSANTSGSIIGGDEGDVMPLHLGISEL